MLSSSTSAAPNKEQLCYLHSCLCVCAYWFFHARIPIDVKSACAVREANSEQPRELASLHLLLLGFLLLLLLLLLCLLLTGGRRGLTLSRALRFVRVGAGEATGREIER